MGTTEHNSMTPGTTDAGEEVRSVPQDGAQPTNGVGTESPIPRSKEWLEQQFLNALGENLEWWEANDREIARQHPDWIGKYVAFACRTASKILVVSEDRWEAWQEGMRCPELLELARQEGFHPGTLVCAFRLGENWLWLED